MEPYQSFHYSALGYSHIKKGTVCQDHSASVDAQQLHFAAVSDGHGQKSSFRSDVGSRIAVEIAQEELLALGAELRGQEERLLAGEERFSLLGDLSARIVSGWREGILRHLKENPVTEAEYALAGDMADAFRAGRNLPQIYGATLIAALVTERYLLVMHQGDGRCVVIHENGKTDQPVPWDSRCVGNTSTSLCQSDAAASCRFYLADLRQDRIVACGLVSDGVEDCFATEAGLNGFFCGLISRYAREGRLIRNSLADILPDMSRQGSADDMSVAAVVDPEGAARLADRLELVNRFRVFRAELGNAREKMNSMERKLSHLKSRYKTAAQDYDRNKESILRRGLGFSQEFARAESAFHAARKEYEAYSERYGGFLAQAKTARRNAIHILEVMKMLDCVALLGLEEAEEAYIRQKL